MKKTAGFPCLIFNTLLFLLLWTPLRVLYAAQWQIQQQGSSLTFTATQNNAPISGKFRAFSGNIRFDPEQLKKSWISFTVDMNSVTTSYAAVADTLKTAEWFNTNIFPQASFKSNDIQLIGEKTYMATGELKVKDKTLPLTVGFVVTDYSEEKAHVVGYFILQRNAFAIGTGEWASGDEIKHDVKVSFDLLLTPQTAAR